MAKLLINDQNKAYLNSQGKAYAITNVDAAEGQSPLSVTAAAGRVLRLFRSGSCSQASTPTPSSPVDIVCNNGALTWDAQQDKVVGDTPEALTLSGKNLLDDAIIEESTNNGITIHRAADGTITATGAILSGTYASFVFVLTNPIPPGTYSLSLNRTKKLDSGALVGFGVNGSATVSSRAASLSSSTTDTKTFEVNSDEVANRMVIRLNGELTDFSMHIQVEKGEKVTPYERYVAPTTASVPDLLQVGDYVDEADLISGVIKRKCGLKVLDGTEAWAKVSQYNIFYYHDEIIRYNNPVLAGLSSHFVGSAESNANMPDNSVKLTYVSGYDPGHGAISIKHNASANVDAFKAFLAAQYANGTPVIVVYPLATPTTEQATPQELNTAAGANTIQSSVSGADIRITYKV